MTTRTATMTDTKVVDTRGSLYIQTFGGRKFFLLDPTPDAIDILDIAHALSMICRYTGHVLKFFSVADHSIRASEMVPKVLRLQALMHDASEAYVSDISRPLKGLIGDYAAIEKKIMGAIADKYVFDWHMAPETKEADNRLLMTERRDLMLWTPEIWSLTAEPYPDTIYPRTQEEAEYDFLKVFHRLKGQG